MVVSSVAGTTRDATPFKYKKDYVMIDTAGLRRKSKIEPNSIERYSVIRTIDAIQRCDVAVLIIDASEGVTEQDVKIAGLIDDEGKPSIIAINKWDLVEKDTETMNDFIKKLDIDLAFMKYYKTIFISCETKFRRLWKMDYVYANANRKNNNGLIQQCIGNMTSHHLRKEEDKILGHAGVCQVLKLNVMMPA